MRRMNPILLCTTALALALAPVVPIESTRDDLQGRLDGVVAAGAVGALAEARRGATVWRGVSGVSELGGARPVPTDGRFRAGSVTKTLIATVVLQLAAEGRLRLDDPVAERPGATLRQLLNHTSGVPDYLRTLPFPPSPRFLDVIRRTWTADELIGRTAGMPPTSGFSYSNTGYLLLGRAIEEATGHTYAEEVERRIIRPLRLRGTLMPGTSTRIPGPHPHGYVPIEGEPGLVDVTRMNPSVMGAAGELITTTRDLDRFFAALLGGELLPAHLLAAMKADGMGMFRRVTACGTQVYGNDGDALAYQAFSYATEDGKRRVTVAFTPDHRGDTDAAVDALLDEVFC